MSNYFTVNGKSLLIAVPVTVFVVLVLLVCCCCCCCCKGKKCRGCGKCIRNIFCCCCCCCDENRSSSSGQYVQIYMPDLERIKCQRARNHAIYSPWDTWISPKLFFDQLNAWNLSGIGFGLQTFIQSCQEKMMGHYALLVCRHYKILHYLL